MCVIMSNKSLNLVWQGKHFHDQSPNMTYHFIWVHARINDKAGVTPVADSPTMFEIIRDLLYSKQTKRWPERGRRTMCGGRDNRTFVGQRGVQCLVEWILVVGSAQCRVGDQPRHHQTTLCSLNATI